MAAATQKFHQNTHQFSKHSQLTLHFASLCAEVARQLLEARTEIGFLLVLFCDIDLNPEGTLIN